MSNSMGIDWDSLREAEFPVTARWAYFDHAAVAPLPRCSADAMRAWAEDQEQNGVVHWPDWERTAQAVRERRRAADQRRPRRNRLRREHDPRHRPGRRGVSLAQGDSVVTAAEEYPSNIYPWMNLASRGVTLRQVPSREGRIWVDDLAAAIDGSTRLLDDQPRRVRQRGSVTTSIPWRRSARQRGVALFVDAIQGLGPHVIDVRRTPVDFLAADGHKWLLGPEGAGLLYIRRDWIERLRPIGVGWHSVVGSYNSPTQRFPPEAQCQRWEGGSFNMAGIQAFGASVRLFLELGPAAVSRRVLERAAVVRDAGRLARMAGSGSPPEADLSGIVALERAGVDPDRAVAELRRRGSWFPAAAAGCGSARTSTIMTRT